MNAYTTTTRAKIAHWLCTTILSLIATRRYWQFCDLVTRLGLKTLDQVADLADAGERQVYIRVSAEPFQEDDA